MPRPKSADSEFLQLISATNVNIIGNYILGRTIGEGSFGKVAIKIVDKIHAPAVIREASHVETWRHLHHPNIVQLYEVLTTETKIYMVTEWVSGGEVFDYVVQRGKLDDTGLESRRIFRQIVEAVGYCHEKSFVHRDLKLENILLTDDLQIKVIDFGFTREYNERRLLDTYCGSVAYAAPEMISGKKYSGPQADVWSLGVILYTLLCGYLPFDDDNDANIHKKILDVEFDTPSILKLEASERLTIPSILAHPWLSDADGPSSLRTSPPTPFGNRPDEVSLAQQLMDSGFDVANILASVRSHACDSASALWYLLLQKTRNLNPVLASEPSSPTSPIPAFIFSDSRRSSSQTLRPTDLDRLAAQGVSQRRKSVEATAPGEAGQKLLSGSSSVTGRRGMMMEAMKNTATVTRYPPSRRSSKEGSAGLGGVLEIPSPISPRKTSGVVIEEDEQEDETWTSSAVSNSANMIRRPSSPTSLSNWDNERQRTESVISDTSEVSSRAQSVIRTSFTSSARKRGRGGLKARYGQSRLDSFPGDEPNSTSNNNSTGSWDDDEPLS
ncbi:hypothetical protein SmJEL517_g05643 [Synchytrium microbalum]|uniref:Protein kinase domain-containing protein n=1 Tax=Synchytrium microbalum TaxID=1806994 RepID=A0A507BYT4_9FUNG|nr:uncharacterized protein SmJEL517_g05643 [Synchytrium microbalum]TPX30896.1 hypothetical protein SmJEL517_g05643 [Synchytrium microbalum]